MGLLLCFFLSFQISLQELLKYDYNLVSQGQVWRLLSCHLVHVDIKHAFFNLLALLSCLLIFERLKAVEWLALSVVSGLIIALCLFELHPNIVWYMGFSGILHAWVAAGSYAWFMYGEKKLASVFLVLLCLKLIWEQYRGVTILSGDALIITEAHLYGAISGLIYAILFFRVCRKAA